MKMGSGDSKQDKGSSENDSSTNLKKEFVLVDAIINCLSQQPLKGAIDEDENVIEELVTTLRKMKVKASRDIFLKRSDGLGIYIIKKGLVEVVSEHDEVTIATLSQGQFFGEVSALYNVPCTASVRALTDCELILLKKEVIRKYTQGYVSMELLDWFVRQKYLPTSSDVDRPKMLRRLCLKTMRSVSVFEGWSDIALKTLILTMEKDLVVLYPQKSTIMDQGDPPVLLYIVLRGRVRVKRDDVILVEFNTDYEPVAFNEKGLRLGHKSCYRLQAITCCEVIPIRLRHIAETMDMERRQRALEPWQNRQKMWERRADFLQSDLYRLLPAEFQLEVLAKVLKRTEVFGGCSLAVLYDLVLVSNVNKYERRARVDFNQVSDSPVIVMVLDGRVKIKPESGKSYTLRSSTEGQAILDPLDWDESYTVTMVTKCVLLEIPRNKAMEITCRED
ncbi:uncharacterized protein LOC135462151 [Liolophura sinensis]|uniref:uncharacterized protein LOC135462151 n=1 Tax=Liolophura sinensis TaxID=3198878 RepID=UPI0031596079